jgi:glutamate-1-semialdehyde 2,1-aminomutase
MLERERVLFASTRPGSAKARAGLEAHWLGGVPMHWMRDWPMPYPLVVRSAVGIELVDVDGHRYFDFCLGDTGAMFGHSPPAVAAAIRERAGQGLTTMLPTEDAVVVGALLAERFVLPFWQMTQTATDANRAVLRWARAITGRPHVLVFDGCYHGTVDETMVSLREGRAAPRPGLVGPVVAAGSATRVVEFNDLEALERALADGKVACVLCEPVMTNCGMVLPQEGYHATLREMTRRHGTLLVIDETHTLSSGLGGYTRVHRLEPDFFVAGKAIAGGLPCAVYGFTSAVAERMSSVLATKEAGHSGIGTTLSANPLAMAALRANLRDVMTEHAYSHMSAMAARLTEGLSGVLGRRGLPWHVSHVGARVELGFREDAPRTGRASLETARPDLEQALHLFLLNRGVLITPFHNMMLASPVTPPEAVDRLVNMVDECVGELLAEAA